MTKTQVINLRITDDLATRLDAEVDRFQAQHPAAEVNRSTVVRAALTEYLNKKEESQVKMYVYETENNTVVAIITGNSNAECEEVAGDMYGDTDLYGWAYESGEQLSRAKQVAVISYNEWLKEQ